MPYIWIAVNETPCWQKGVDRGVWFVSIARLSHVARLCRDVARDEKQYKVDIERLLTVERYFYK